MGIKVFKAETVSIQSVIFVKIPDGILQTAGFPNNRNRTVTHGDHLAQAAGFVPGGHNEHIGACIYPACQTFIKQNIYRNAARMSPGQFPQRIGIFFIACSYHNKLHLFFHQFIHDMGNQVQAFGLHQTGDHGQYRNFPVYVQAQLPLQRFLGQRFFQNDIGYIKANRQVGIRCRIVFFIIQPVQDTADLSGTQGNIILQSFPEIGIGNFFRISWAYCCNVVRIAHTGFHKVHVTGIFNVPVIKKAHRHTQHIFHDVFSKYALIFQVMDGVNIFQILIERILHKIFFQVRPKKAGVPVVAVDHVRHEIDMGKHGQYGFCKISKPLCVIVEPIQLFPLKIIFIVNKIYCKTIVHKLLHAHVLVTPGQVYRPGIHRFHKAFIFFTDRSVIRDHQGRFHPQPLQCFR